MKCQKVRISIRHTISAAGCMDLSVHVQNSGVPKEKYGFYTDLYEVYTDFKYNMYFLQISLKNELKIFKIVSVLAFPPTSPIRLST